MTGPSIKIGTYAELGTAADELRRQVFIDEQGVPEEEIFDGLSGQAVHTVVFDGGVPVATVRMRQDGDSWRIGLVAVDKSRRGQHLGEKMMRTAMAYIAVHDGREIALTAQQQAKGFYEKLGFRQCGEIKVLESGFVLVPMKY
ncbi:GCN5-related N-acetyltransferase [Syntrophobotulus glycolicus DSM 8271]|uniref:GCN5-related N-acetyltransferase n=1 Tax=Syntrophobotulus glycolicus (strain DSM 8271 / FlGlyR) TaxID=645991 RepID=F0T2H4_SYNGF|nr:GNAT family N-acetyltransferase [Syntrophobotulus glycolicus]ADY55292.1 GCN5-related N-acetyltransferase [Syntrophobotulus glycolicus DSM 8271]